MEPETPQPELNTGFPSYRPRLGLRFLCTTVLIVAVPAARGVWVIICKITFTCTEHGLGTGSVLYKCWLLILLLTHGKPGDGGMPVKEGIAGSPVGRPTATRLRPFPGAVVSGTLLWVSSL